VVCVGGEIEGPAAAMAQPPPQYPPGYRAPPPANHQPYPSQPAPQGYYYGGALAAAGGYPPRGAPPTQAPLLQISRPGGAPPPLPAYHMPPGPPPAAQQPAYGRYGPPAGAPPPQGAPGSVQPPLMLVRGAPVPAFGGPAAPVQTTASSLLPRGGAPVRALAGARSSAPAPTATAAAVAAAAAAGVSAESLQEYEERQRKRKRADEARQAEEEAKRKEQIYNIPTAKAPGMTKCALAARKINRSAPQQKDLTRWNWPLLCTARGLQKARAVFPDQAQVQERAAAGAHRGQAAVVPAGPDAVRAVRAHVAGGPDQGGAAD